jgi:hypothetical protein
LYYCLAESRYHGPRDAAARSKIQEEGRAFAANPEDFRNRWPRQIEIRYPQYLTMGENRQVCIFGRPIRNYWRAIEYS